MSDTWGTLDAPDIPMLAAARDGLEGLEAIITGVQTVLNAVEIPLSLVEQAINLYMDPTVDGLEVTINAATAVLANLLVEFLEAGFYFLPVVPESAIRGHVTVPILILKDGLEDPVNPIFPHKLLGEDPQVDSLFAYSGITAVIDTLDGALRDTGDYCRPTLGENAYVGGAVLAFSFDSPEDAAAAKGAIDFLFDCTQLSSYIASFNIARLSGDDLTYNCTAPDFMRISLLNLFPPLQEAIMALHDWADLMNSYPSTLVAAWIKQINETIAFINLIIDLIDSILTTLAAIQTLQLAFIVLSPQQGGTANFVARLRAAVNQPTNDQMAAFIIMYGSETPEDYASKEALLTKLLPFIS